MLYGQVYKERKTVMVHTTCDPNLAHEHQQDIDDMLKLEERWTLVTATTTCVISPRFRMKESEENLVYYTTILFFERPMTDVEMEECDKNWKPLRKIEGEFQNEM